MKCIFCKKEKAKDQFAPEHVFPEAIGGTLAIEGVSAECNSIIGSKVDSRLTDHPIVTLIRGILNLPGKKGKLPVQSNKVNL